MPQPVPLRRALRVKCPHVIVHDPRFLLVDLFVEGLAAEEGEVVLGVEGPVEVDAGAGLDFGVGGAGDEGGGEAVEGAELVFGAVAVGEEGERRLVCAVCFWVERWRVGFREGGGVCLQAPGVVVWTVLVQGEVGEFGYLLLLSHLDELQVVMSLCGMVSTVNGRVDLDGRIVTDLEEGLPTGRYFI